MSVSVETVKSNLMPMLHAAGESDLLFWTADQLERWARDWLFRHAQQQGVFVLRDTATTLVAGTATYDAPADHLDTIHVSTGTAVSSGDDALDQEDDFSLLLESGDEILLESATFETSGASALVASSTTEIEGLSETLTTAETAADPTSRWYADRTGSNRIGLYPVPATGLSAGATLEVIYHGFPCEFLASNAIAPAVISDWVELAVLSEAYSAEGDAQMVEVTQSARQVMGLIDEVVFNYWGRAQ